MITNNLYVIAAICGNFWQESTVNPGIWEGLTVGAPGYGLGQWTDNPPQVMRRTALFNWLSAHGYAQDSGEGQLAFLVAENVWIPSLYTTSAYSALSDYLNSNSTNLSDLVLEFMHHWEGINDNSFNERLNGATDFLYLFQNDPGTRTAWHSSNAHLSTYQANDNALLIMDYFLGAQPVPSPTDEEILALVSLVLKRRKRGGGLIVF